MQENQTHIIGYVHQLGREFQIKYPDITRGCLKNGLWGQVEKIILDDPESYGNTNSGLLYSGLRHALIGVEENDFQEGYDGLADNDIYEEIKECGGDVAFEEGKGTFALTREEKQEIGKKSVIKLHKINSNIVWSDAEKEDFLKLRKDDTYKTGKRVDYFKISKELNQKYHLGIWIRNHKSLDSQYQRLKKEQKLKKNKFLDWNQGIDDKHFGKMSLVEYAHMCSQRNYYRKMYGSRERLDRKKLVKHMNNKFSNLERKITENSLANALNRYSDEK